MSGSSARTCSAPAPTRFAAPTTVSCDLTDEEKARGVVAASAGNHAQGVAFAARELGIRSTIFMPVGVALPKLAATKEYGADVELSGNVVDETLRAAAAFAKETGAVFIHPFDHRDVVAGQGTLGLEILEQHPGCRHHPRSDRRRRTDLRRRQRGQAEVRSSSGAPCASSASRRPTRPPTRRR